MDPHDFSEFLEHMPAINAALQTLLMQATSSGNTFGAIRDFAVRVENATQQEFPGHRIGELGRQLRREIHDRPGSDAMRTVETLLNELSSRVGKIQGHRSFEDALVLYVLLGQMWGSRDPEHDPADTLLGQLMGQGTSHAGSQQRFVNIWNEMIISPDINVNGRTVEQARIIAHQLSLDHAFEDVAGFLDSIEGVCGYVVSNILPDTSEVIALSSSSDIKMLLLNQIAAWYFLPYGQPLTPGYVRQKLKSRGAPYRYDRYLGHALMQSALLETLAFFSEAHEWLAAPEAGLAAELAVVHSEYLVNVAFWNSVIDFDKYEDAIVSVRFSREMPSFLNSFLSQFNDEHDLAAPEDLLHEIRVQVRGDASGSSIEQSIRIG